MIGYVFLSCIICCDKYTMLLIVNSLRVVLGVGVDSLRVEFKSDSSSLGLPYNEGGTTRL
jgi:hypothetical protein